MEPRMALELKPERSLQGCPPQMSRSRPLMPGQPMAEGARHFPAQLN